MFRRVLLVISAIVAVPAGASASSVPAESLANRCVTVSSLAGGPVYLKATGLGGRFMLYDHAGRLVAAAPGGRIARIANPRPAAEWTIALAELPLGSRSAPRFTIRSTATHRLLDPRHSMVTLRPASRCTPFPEAQVGASGKPFKGPRPGGKVFGFVDAHLHVTANMRAGGRVIYGEPFDRFGIAAALGRDAKYHGSHGQFDYTGNLLRSGSPTGTHDTHGWPTFKGWPVYNTQTHQQSYYVWLQRVWEAGERLMVAQTVDDRPLCMLEPRRNGGCDETRSIKAQIRELKAMQDYIDAQNGGSGRGWFRLVYSPAQARQAIARGKLAVIIGIESSDPFDCSVVLQKTKCKPADVERGLRMYERLGVRGMFVAHWINNAFSGAALESGAKGLFINLLNRLQTGSYFQTGRCPIAGQGATVLTLPKSILEFLAGFFPSAKPIAAQGMPSYPNGTQCNDAGLTGLGRYLIERMIAHHFLIEVDHLSEEARDTVLSIAERAHYPLISSHNGTGGVWTPAELMRLYRLGGYVSVTPAQAPQLAGKITAMSQFKDRRYYFGVGIGTDTGGFASQPAPRSDAAEHPLSYPFRSYDGKVTFGRERTGARTFDLNRDGVAHYGLIADLLADMRSAPGGSRALSLLFRSAEAYLETWERAWRHR